MSLYNIGIPRLKFGIIYKFALYTLLSSFILLALISSILIINAQGLKQIEALYFTLLIAVAVMLILTIGFSLYLLINIKKPVTNQFNLVTTNLKSYNASLERQIDEMTKLERKWAEHFRLIDIVGYEISTILSEEDILPFVVESVYHKFQYHIDIFLIDQTTGKMVLKTGEDNYDEPSLTSAVINDKDIIERVFRTGQSVTVNNINEQSMFINPRHPYSQSEIAVPIKLGNDTIGLLDLYDDQPGAFGQVDLYTMTTLSSQIAVSLKYAKLYKQAQELATKEERQRLAHELHDAVTQTLFSANLVTEVLPMIWEKDPIQGRKSLNELKTLIRSALTEMRSLLMEMRPTAITKADLSDLLRRLATEFTSCTNTAVSLNFCDEPELPSNIKYPIYRIAQEALSNIKKHALATQVTMDLKCQDNQLELVICDDGIGFRQENVSSEHLGLTVMRERAEAIHAKLEIASKIEQGTRVKIIWQDPAKRRIYEKQ